jgi:aryl-alcohol dehydrogenase-like predicted oxidoreductase
MAEAQGVWERRLGRPGLPVTAIGLGLAALGRPGYLTIGHGRALGPDRSVEAMERHAHEVLDAAYAGGIRYFDAARSYGRAEAFLASWLAARGLTPGDVTVGSKWGYTYTADWQVDADPPEVKDLSVDALRRQLGETRALLGAHLSLYQIHSATIESGVLDDHAVRAELDALRGAGVAIGLTTTGPDQAATIDRGLAVDGFDCVQATWNLLEPSVGPALARAHDAGLGVIVKEALANGRLAEALGPDWDAVGIAAALAQPWCDVVLSGAATIEQVRSNLVARDLRGPVPEVEPEPPDAYWSRRSALPWN